MLLKEEMRRTLAFLAWRAKWWHDCAGSRPGHSTPEMAEALEAYAEEQACLQEELSRNFQKLWEVPLDDSNPDPQPVLPPNPDKHSNSGLQAGIANDDDEIDDDEGDDEYDEDKEGEEEEESAEATVDSAIALMNEAKDL